MTKIVEKSLSSVRKAASKEKGLKIARKLVRDANGQSHAFRSLEASGEGLTEALTYVFRKNVERAREENRRVIGSLSGN
jgi:hypothetical protein